MLTPDNRKVTAFTCYLRLPPGYLKAVFLGVDRQLIQGFQAAKGLGVGVAALDDTAATALDGRDTITLDHGSTEVTTGKLIAVPKGAATVAIASHEETLTHRSGITGTTEVLRIHAKQLKDCTGVGVGEVGVGRLRLHASAVAERGTTTTKLVLTGFLADLITLLHTVRAGHFVLRGIGAPETHAHRSLLDMT
jgi:hypothetical protein